ncbi:MAG: DEAD/DEAH box helicase [Candidatus Micrarchaeota archaeon]|nr:DEAD/DEAH box helicase [Candidatus Micrarchaeota archaeon]
MDLSWGELAPYDRLVNTALIEPRSYQINIIKSIYSGRNTLVVLPTGLGKTLIAIFAIAQSLHNGKRALILAPTKPLGEQHYKSLSDMLNIDKEGILLLTGGISRSKRQELEASAKVIVATPQTVSNDLKRGRISLEDFGAVIFDECHRAVGRYAYTYIAEESKLRGLQLIGLTASPGSDRKKINALISELGIENIEIRISSDPDVEPYVMRKDTTVITTDKGRVVEGILALLKPVIDTHLSNLYSHGLSPFRDFQNMPKGRLLQIGDAIRKIEARNYRFMGIFNYVYVLDLAHAYDLVSTEGLYPFVSYMESLEGREKKSRTVKSILSNKSVIAAKKLAVEAIERGEEHPKMSMVVRLLKGDLGGSSAIVFAQFRSTTRRLTALLKENGIEATEFIGKGGGVTQEEQQRIIRDFRSGKFKVLVATSIGEEGLDIPNVDAVVFYEPIPNEIRSIQRKGRAGRVKFGRIFILVTKGTKDETYLFISRVKERRMRDNVLKIKDRMDRGFDYRAPSGGQRLLAK